MENLVELVEGQVMADSRKVAEVFEKRHDHILRDIDKLKTDLPNFGEMFVEGTAKDSYGREQKTYFMNRDGFSLLVMGFTGAKALQWKIKYIEAFNIMEKKLKEVTALTPAEIVAKGLLAANQLLQEKDEKIKVLEKHIETNRPKTAFADAVCASKQTILMRDLAKLLRQNGVDIGEKRLYQWMREHGYIMKHSTMPTQKAMDMGLFEITESTIIRGDSTPLIKTTTKITGKGQIYFVNKFAKAVVAC